MDGIPVLRNEQGDYPEKNGGIAARIAAKSICNFLKNIYSPSRDTRSCHELILRAFINANADIRATNHAHRIYDKKEPQWIATVGCALWANTEKNEAYFAYIGDPLAFLIHSHGGCIELLTEDQLRDFENHLRTKHKDEFKDAGTSTKIREHQDKFVRNVKYSKCFCGKSLRGWGALTGQPEAMEFVVLNRIETPPGTRVILASDAIEAIGAGNAKEREVEDYKNAFFSIIKLSPVSAARELLRLTRAGEEEKKCKSDDATFVVIDF